MELGGVSELVDQANRGAAAFLLFLLVVEGVDEVFELSAAELAGANAEDEAYGIHEVGFAGAIGADNGGEVVKRTDGLEALVGLEILEL